MGVNRIVMQSGVVWWLAPPSRRRGAPGGTAARSPADLPRSEGADESPRDAAALPPAGFIPLSSLGLPGIDAILGKHADIYRQAYERAIRDLEGSGDGDDRPGGDAAPPPADAAR